MKKKHMTEEEILQKREYEKKLVSIMIEIYCKGNHNTNEFCDECKQLKEYAFKRIDCCPFMETKTFCSACKVHCYSPKNREKIREVMKYSGKRMLFKYPKVTLYHILVSIKAKLDK